MDTELMLDVGQANELKLAFRRAGWTNPDIKRMTEGDALAQILPFIRGYAEVKLVKHVIDCDADPFIPDGWKVEKHIKGGQTEWNPAKVRFHLSPNQQGGKSIEGNKLRKELEKEPVLNANMLDYLLKNPILIPEDWKKDEKGNTRYIFFWGTIYRSSGDYLYVRCLCWLVGAWHWGDFWLDRGWGGDDPAACSQD